MSDHELLSEIREIMESLARVESMLRFIIEKNIEEVELLPDEIEAIEAKDELVDRNEIKQRLSRNK